MQLSVVVGLAEALQQTPLVVTGAPPSDDTIPPLVHADNEIELTFDVETIGKNWTSDVKNICSFPYVVPDKFVA